MRGGSGVARSRSSHPACLPRPRRRRSLGPRPHPPVSAGASSPSRAGGHTGPPGASSWSITFGYEERRDAVDDVPGLVEQEEVTPTGDHDEPGSWDPRGEDTRVRQRHDGVVVTGEDEGRVRNPVQPGQGAVAARTSPADTSRRLAGQLLRHSPAEAQTQHVPAARPRPSRTAPASPAMPRIRRGGDRRRLAGAGQVEGHRLDAAADEGALERIPRLEAGADACDQRQRPPLAAHRRAQPGATCLDIANPGRWHGGLRSRWRLTRRR